jgi:hypothetical protein
VGEREAEIRRAVDEREREKLAGVGVEGKGKADGMRITKKKNYIISLIP